MLLLVTLYTLLFLWWVYSLAQGTTKCKYLHSIYFVISTHSRCTRMKWMFSSLWRIIIWLQITVLSLRKNILNTKPKIVFSSFYIWRIFSIIQIFHWCYHGNYWSFHVDHCWGSSFALLAWIHRWTQIYRCFFRKNGKSLMINWKLILM